VRLNAVNQQPASRVLSAELTFQCLDTRGRSVDLPAAFGYDASDPWAVRITFGRPGEQVTWVVGRDLLVRGLTDPAGEGDVQVWPSIDEYGRAAVVIEFRSPDGRLVTQLRTHDLYRFLARSQAIVPSGTESIDLDLLVEDLLTPSEPQ
jgi:hypothetical protein